MHIVASRRRFYERDEFHFTIYIYYFHLFPPFSSPPTAIIYKYRIIIYTIHVCCRLFLVFFRRSSSLSSSPWSLQQRVIHINNTYIYIWICIVAVFVSPAIVWCVILSRFRVCAWCEVQPRYLKHVAAAAQERQSVRGGKSSEFSFEIRSYYFFPFTFGNTRVNDLLEISPPPRPLLLADSHTRVSSRLPSRYLQFLSTAREHVRGAQLCGNRCSISNVVVTRHKE